MGELTEGRGQTWKMSDLFQMFLCEIRVKHMTGNVVAVLFRGGYENIFVLYAVFLV